MGVTVANDDILGPNVIRGVDPNGNQKNVATDASGKLLSVVTPSTSAGGAEPVNLIAQSSSTTGLTSYTNLDTQQVGVSVSTAACQLYGFHFYNAGATIRVVKLYNQATVPTSTDIAKITKVIPAGSGANVFGDIGVTFSVGMGIRAVTGIVDSSTGAPGTNDVVTNLFYK